MAKNKKAPKKTAKAVKTATKKSPAKKSAPKKSQPKIKAKAKPAAKAASAKPAARAAVAPKTSTKIDFKKLLPLEDRLLVHPEGAAEKTAGGLYIPVTVSDRPNQGTVLASGRGKRNKKGQVRPLDVEVGDKVLFAQYAGAALEVDGQEYLILRESEILGIVT